MKLLNPEEANIFDANVKGGYKDKYVYIAEVITAHKFSAKQLGISGFTLSNWKKPAKPKVSTDKVKEYLEYMSVKETADELGISLAEVLKADREG